MERERGRLGDADFPGTGEIFDTLAGGGGARVERILSAPTDTPGPWYDQDGDEWVALLQGEAELSVVGAGGVATREILRAGDWRFLPARLRHRVERVRTPSIWLAVHFAKRERV